jgi:DNA-binding response OmpR family regulator
MSEHPKKIILIAEDEASILRILTDTLKENGFETIQAKNGHEGLALALEKHPDLILLDILMPQMDGLTVMNKLRSEKWGKGVPVIILTNVSPDTDASLHAIMEYQPAYYIMKSNIQIDQLLEKINSIFSSPSSNTTQNPAAQS